MIYWLALLKGRLQNYSSVVFYNKGRRGQHLRFLILQTSYKKIKEHR